MPKLALARLVYTSVFALLVGGGGYLGYRAARSSIVADAYRERLEAVARDYEELRGRYNEAVRRTAVTELVVKGNTLTVLIRTADGAVRTVETKLDPRNEVYVDYVVMDGRLLIRRLFDAWTPPSSGLVLDEHLEHVDWNDPGADHGKAVYRQLGEGRWVISVSGNGALELTRVGDADSVDLKRAPEIREYGEAVKEADAEVEGIGPGDVLRWMRR